MPMRFCGPGLPEGDGTVLDNSLIVSTNEFATAGPQTYHRVGCTVLNLMGIPADGFGDETSCGILRGLDVRV